MIHFLVRFPYMKQIGHVFLYYIISTRTQCTLSTLTDAGISLHRAILYAAVIKSFCVRPLNELKIYLKPQSTLKMLGTPAVVY